jgi:hypothetical protein
MSYSTLPVPCALFIQSIRYDPFIRTRGIHRHNPNGFTNFVQRKPQAVTVLAREERGNEPESWRNELLNAAAVAFGSAGSRQQCMQQFAGNFGVVLLDG